MSFAVLQNEYQLKTLQIHQATILPSKLSEILGLRDFRANLTPDLSKGVVFFFYKVKKYTTREDGHEWPLVMYTFFGSQVLRNPKAVTRLTDGSNRSFSIRISFKRNHR